MSVLAGHRPDWPSTVIWRDRGNGSIEVSQKDGKVDTKHRRKLADRFIGTCHAARAGQLMGDEDFPCFRVAEEDVLNEHGRADGAIAGRCALESGSRTVRCRTVFDIITRHVLNVIPRRRREYLLTFKQVCNRCPAQDFGHRCPHPFPHFLLHAHAWDGTRTGTKCVGTRAPPPTVRHGRKELLSFHGLQDCQQSQLFWCCNQDVATTGTAGALDKTGATQECQDLIKERFGYALAPCDRLALNRTLSDPFCEVEDRTHTVIRTC